MKEKYYNAKGWKIFFYSEDDIYTIEKDKEFYKQCNPCKDNDFINAFFELNFDRDKYDMYDGEEFLSLVSNGCITNYDGTAADVFVDGFRSNLGLLHDNIQIGGFLVDKDVWMELCKEYKIEVNWVNK